MHASRLLRHGDHIVAAAEVIDRHVIGEKREAELRRLVHLVVYDAGRVLERATTAAAILDAGWSAGAPCVAALP